MGGARTGWAIGAQDLLLGPERLGFAVRHHEHLIHGRERAGPVRDHDRDPAARPHVCNGLREGLLALAIQV